MSAIFLDFDTPLPHVGTFLALSYLGLEIHTAIFFSFLLETKAVEGLGTI
jgi:hypothetical protein